MGWGGVNRRPVTGFVVGKVPLGTHRVFPVSYFLQMLYTHSLITLTLLNPSNLNAQHVST